MTGRRQRRRGVVQRWKEYMDRGESGVWRRSGSPAYPSAGGVHDRGKNDLTQQALRKKWREREI
jgi:hypothetical protein